MTTKPLISIIVPSHNRPDCAVSAVRSLLKLADCVEIVLSDTSEIDAISKKIASYKCSRLKYIRPERKMSVVEHFNYALQHSEGEFIVFIGDDDLVSPDIVDVALWAKKNDADALSFSFPALYYWPNFISSTRWAASSGTLSIDNFEGGVRPINCRQELHKSLQNLGAGVLGMPRAYAGMISRDLLDRISDKYGELFGGVSPDIYSAALISMESLNSYFIDFPIIIPGASGGSTSGQSANGRHEGALRENAHISAFKDLIWDHRVPEFYSVPTVWAYSLLKAVDLNPEWKRSINLPNLYFRIVVNNFKYKNYVKPCVLEYISSNSLLKILSDFFVLNRNILIFISLKMKIKFSKKNRRIVFENIEDTDSAYDIFVDYMKNNRIKLDI
ncbi:glycosyltransferase family 2 protein [Comamonas suwonensis]|uniref:glycosyltransferase family 2 protein n=1 Tax=Comamonas suwonensis TaxID=2606214 RepID=UPI00145F31A8|nr:glycosyltransferase [Comamonas suwonensis]MBI1624168.1 glycosyltransferase [Comamonas suwonensis]